MAVRLEELRVMIAEYAAELDPERVSPDEAAAGCEEAAAIEASAYAIKSLLSTRAVYSHALKEAGSGSATDELAKRTGVSGRDAEKLIETGKRLGENDEVGRAARRGELSPRQAQLIAGAAGKNPAAATELLEGAKGASIHELEQACRKAEAAADVDLEQRRRRVHRARRFSGHTDDDGTHRLYGQGLPENGEFLMSVLSPRAIERQREAARLGGREPFTAHLYDALVDLARQSVGLAPLPTGMPGTSAPGSPTRGWPPPNSAVPDSPSVQLPLLAGTPADAAAGQVPLIPAPAGVPTNRPIERAGAKHAETPIPSASRTPGRKGRPPGKVIFRVNLDAFVRGRTRPGEICEMSGAGPVAVSVVRDAIVGDGASVNVVFEAGDHVQSVAHLGNSKKVIALLEDESALVDEALSRAEPVAGVAHRSRGARAHQQTALEAIYPT
ncbi:MAG TPA: hypothetical protein VGS21_07855, partial [Acidimicrobiales bacterium]|nr:hypothetical protein [Acidimicrobiales bacterium]